MVEHKWKNMYFFIFQEENQYKQRGTEEFWRGRQLSWVESVLLLKLVIYYTASCSILQKIWYQETCVDSSFHYKELRETSAEMCFSIHRNGTHGYLVRSVRKKSNQRWQEDTYCKVVVFAVLICFLKVSLLFVNLLADDTSSKAKWYVKYSQNCC